MKKKILYIFIVLFIGLFSSNSVKAVEEDPPCQTLNFYCPDGTGYTVIVCELEDLRVYYAELCGVIIL